MPPMLLRKQVATVNKQHRLAVKDKGRDRDKGKDKAPVAAVVVQQQTAAHPARAAAAPTIRPDQIKGLARAILDTVFAPIQQGQLGDPDFLPGRQTEAGSETIRESANPLPRYDWRCTRAVQ